MNKKEKTVKKYLFILEFTNDSNKLECVGTSTFICVGVIYRDSHLPLRPTSPPERPRPTYALSV